MKRLLLGCLLALGCGADPQPSATSANDEPASATAPRPPVASAASAAPSAAAPGLAASARSAPANAAGDPAALLGGGAALDALPARATSPGKAFDPKLRQRLMAPPNPDPLKSN